MNVIWLYWCLEEREGEVMKRFVKRIARQEKGHGLDLVLTLLGLGGLIMAPLLGLTSTGLLAGRVYEENTHELYAADAGVEYGIWHLQQGGSANDTLECTISGKSVTVEIEELPHDCNEIATYEITSTAVSQDGGSTTVLAHVKGITVYMDELTVPATEGPLYFPTNVYIDGDVYLSSEVHIVGNMKAGGNVVLNQGSLIGGIVCVGGYLEMNNNATIEANVYVAEYLTMNNYASIIGGTDVGGAVTMTGSSNVIGFIHAGDDVSVDGKDALVDGDICANGNVQVAGQNALVDGNVYAGGTITADPAKITGTRCPGGACGVCEIEPCPLTAGHPEILVWVIL